MIKHHPVIKIFSVYFVLIFLLSPVLAGGCSTENDKGAGTPVLGGWVSAGQPISAATISIYDIDGKQIYQSEQAVTGEYGSFLFEIKSLPADFKVIAAGGTIDEELFAADLSADYRGFDANIDTVHINPLTTLVNAYYENHQGIGLGDAIAKVKSFLQLPDWLDINEELDVVPQYFSYSEFLSAAASSGGVNKYIEQLVGEMDAQEAATHSFGDEDIVYESSTNMIGTISMWVAQGVVSNAVKCSAGA